jgi:serine/threonine protein phosphatase PrpC
MEVNRMQTNQHNRPRSGEAVRRWLLARRPSAQPPLYLRGSLRGLLLGSAAYVLSQAPLLFSVNPLAAALLCATDGQIGYVLFGILLGLWQRGAPSGWWYVASAAVILMGRCIARLYFTPRRPSDACSPQQLRRLYFKQRMTQLKRLCYQGGNEMMSDKTRSSTTPLPPLFDEPIAHRVTVSLLAALIPCLGIPATGGFVFYDLYGAVFYLLLSPTATALFAISLSADIAHPRATSGASWRLLGVGTLLAAVSFCGRTLSIFSLLPVVVLCVAVCLYAVRQHGLGAGVFLAMICGIAFDPLIIPMYLCLVIVYAFLAPAIGRFALLPATLASLIYLLICSNDSALLVLSPSLAVGVLTYSVALRLHGHWQTLLERAEEAHTSGCVSNDHNRLLFLLEQAQNEQIIARISGISGAFSNLSEVLRQLQDKCPMPPPDELRRLCEQCFEAHCPDCPHHDVCHNDESLEILTTLHSLCRCLTTEGVAKEQCLETGLYERCPHRRKIIEEINFQIKRRSYELLHGSQHEQFSLCCEDIAHLLRDMAHHPTQTDEATNLALSASLASYLNKHSIEAREAFVFGEHQKHMRISGLTPAGITCSQEEFRRDMSKLLHAPVSRLHYDGADDGTFSLHTLPALRADYVHRTLSAEQNKKNTKKRPACGDTLRVFEAQQGVFCALICDGMGHGREAAKISGVCGIFLERLLRAGVPAQSALRLLNHYLLTRTTTPEQEICCTVDLLILDLYTGKGHLFKCGAAPSIIRRRGRLFRLASHTLPIGILHAIDTGIIPFEVQGGDQILLMSDGVSDADGDEGGENWLSDLLQGAVNEDDSALLESLFSGARARGSHDDMSAISIHLSGTQATE